MSMASTFVIILLVLLLLLTMSALLMYYFTQQDLKNITAKLQSLDARKDSAPQASKSDTLRRERAAAFDRLVMLEAELHTEARQELSAQELQLFEACRKSIKDCNAELKRLHDWMGLPYDVEWPDIKQRVPRTTVLYRQAVDAALKEAQGG